MSEHDLAVQDAPQDRSFWRSRPGVALTVVWVMAAARSGFGTACDAYARRGPAFYPVLRSDPQNAH